MPATRLDRWRSRCRSGKYRNRCCNCCRTLTGRTRRRRNPGCIRRNRRGQLPQVSPGSQVKSLLHAPQVPQSAEQLAQSSTESHTLSLLQLEQLPQSAAQEPQSSLLAQVPSPQVGHAPQSLAHEKQVSPSSHTVLPQVPMAASSWSRSAPNSSATVVMARAQNVTRVRDSVGETHRGPLGHDRARWAWPSIVRSSDCHMGHGYDLVWDGEKSG